MTINTTRWTNDTCGCVVEYDWDDSIPQDSRTHTVSNVISKCAAHAAISDMTQHFNILLDENPRKNLAHQHAIDTIPALLSSTGAVGGRLKDTITYNFSFSGTAPNRVLTISFTSVTLTTAQKNSIQNALNTKFGAGKVVIV